MQITIRLFAALLVACVYTSPLFADHKNRRHGKKLERVWVQMIDSGNAYTSEELMPLFLKLKPVHPDDLFGTWEGGKFDGGLPDPINWYGKRFISMEYVEPLLITAADGSIQVYEGLGAARLREVLFENRVSATLIYDRQPIMDYFRMVNDDLIIGWGEVKGDTPDFFFWLQRVSDE